MKVYSCSDKDDSMNMNEINVNRLKDFKKKQRLSELKMLGINEGIVYPDFPTNHLQ